MTSSPSWSSAEWPWDPAPPLEEVYDEATLAALDAGVEPEREAFAPEPGGGGRIEVVRDTGPGPVDGVPLHFVPDDPQGTVAVVRRPIA